MRPLPLRRPAVTASPRREADRLGAARHRATVAFAVAVVATGAGFVAALAAAGWFDDLDALPAVYAVFFGLVLVSEVAVLRLPSRRNEVLLSASSLVAYATALRFGPGPAILALVAGTLAKDVSRRLPPIKTAFNVAQHALSVGAAGLVYVELGGGGDIDTAARVGAALAGAAVYLAVNYLLTTTVVALATGAGVGARLRGSLASWVPVEGVMLACAPVVAAATSDTLALLPLLLVPLVGVRHTARIALRAEHDALHDALTGMPNRTLFRERLEECLVRARLASDAVVVLVLDLDGFRDVNDTLGHGRGDELLLGVAGRLRATLRDADVVARLGGDEWGVVATSPGGDPGVVDGLVRSLQDALALPLEVSDLWIVARASIGIAIAPGHGTDAETLIRRADVALYEAKDRPGSHAIYAPENDPNRPERLRLAQELRRAVGHDGELVLHFQPKLALGTGALVGVEALVRWEHPSRGLLPPGEFIELAERSDVVRALTLQVARLAAARARVWLDQGLRIPIAINLSPRVLLDVTIADDLIGLLEEHGVAPSLFEVEVTESSIVVDPDRTAAVLARLSAAGVRVSIDDFGTGYSSLALLKRLPVDAVKIDRGFVGGITNDRDDRAIVASTVGLAASLGLRSIAEGVETDEAWELLRDLGCDEAQGYLIARPLAGPAFEAWLANASPPLPA